jgi:hypothetical protein
MSGSSRLGGKRFLGKGMTAQTEARVETRDAIVYDLISAGICRVKIQGSDEPIVAYYQLGRESAPNYVTPGQTVRVNHRGGIRGLTEIVGIGQTVPTTAPGGSSPVIATGSDGILTGGQVTATLNTPDMSVHVAITTYRISGTTYASVATDLTVSAAPATGLWRYDIIVGGTDSIVHLVTGTASATPIVPSTPASHVLLQIILVPGGSTAITQYMIDQTWALPSPTAIVMVITNDELHWTVDLSTAITVTVYDQYGNTMAGTGAGWYITLEFTLGNGTLNSVEDGNDLVKVGQHTGTADHAHFTYTRDNLTTDESPVLTATLEYGTYRSVIGTITLYNASGYPMMDPASGGTLSPTYQPALDQLITYAANITIDWSLGATAYLTLTGDPTITLTNAVNGEVYRLIITQEAVGGGHTITSWTGVDYWQGGGVPTLTTDVNHHDVVTFLRANSKTWAAATLNFSA